MFWHPFPPFPFPCTFPLIWPHPRSQPSSLAREVLAQLSSARCFEGSFIPSLLLAQETGEILLQAELPSHWLWSCFPTCELIRKIRSQFMEENKGAVYKKRYLIYLMVQTPVMSANRYFATYKTEHRSMEECPSAQSLYCFYSSILKSPDYVWAWSTKGPSCTVSSQAPQTAYETAAAITAARSWKLSGSRGWKFVNFSLVQGQACLLSSTVFPSQESTEYLRTHSQKSLTAVMVQDKVDESSQILIASSTLTITAFSFKNWLCQEHWEPSCRL